MSNEAFQERLTNHLKSQNLILVNKDAFLDFMIEVNVKTSVDKRIKWIDRKTTIAKYGVSRYWLEAAEKDVFSLLEVMAGKGKRAPKKYKEQSVIDEQTRQARL